MSRTINKTYIYYNHCCDSCKPITVDVYLLTKHIYFLKSYKRNSQETDQLLPHGSLSHYKYFTSFLIFFSSLHSPCHLRLFFFCSVLNLLLSSGSLSCTKTQRYSRMDPKAAITTRHSKAFHHRNKSTDLLLFSLSEN